ncbi:ceramide transfer protein-like [Amphibalanus amphitrite]|uniref:ceramide transfer protein-like n=1 Tax=Amphibalanus amphitrite TaxID=1232801 RepID=UPI001C905DC5|nr:ceramide transfer protein-like [Amphibalanus amphitrite]
MGLMQRLRRSFRAPKRSDAGKSSVASTSVKSAPAASRASTTSSPSRLSSGVKPVPPPAAPAASGAKTAPETVGPSAVDGQARSGGSGEGSGVVSAGGSGASGAQCCDVSGSGPRSNRAECAAVPNGTVTGAGGAAASSADSVAVQQLATQVSEVRAELASLKELVHSLEARVSRGVVAPRRLPRANSYQPGTKSLVTSSVSLEEGPDCVLSDEEFHDALAVSLLHLEQETGKRDELRRKKSAEMKEEQLRRQKEQEDEDAAKETKQENGENTQDGAKEKENVDQSKDTARKDSNGEQQGEESKDESSKTETQPPTNAVKGPAKPQRSLSREPDTVDSGGVSVPVPVPPAAAPRGGCSGNCSQLGHPLAAEIERVVTEQLGLVSSDVSDGWTLFAQQGDMRMYRMELPADNKSVDPLKAVSKADGVTARELCRAYWEPTVRLDWETTVDRVTVLARPDPSTVICHQLHRRIWPAQQRDTVFWSHLCRRRIGDREWSITVNHSISGHPDEPPAPAGAVRATMTATLAGMDEQEVSGDRRRLRCHVAYSSHVNPGGWAPTTGLRLVYKREYPRFLQRFTTYVTQKSRGKPVEP